MINVASPCVQASALGDLGFYGKGKSAFDFYTQKKVCDLSRSSEVVELTIEYFQTTTSLWKAEDAISTRASVNMLTHNGLFSRAVSCIGPIVFP